MWTAPRATIAQIVEQDPGSLVLVLVSLAGIQQSLVRAGAENLGDNSSLTTIAVAALVAGPIGGIIGLYLGSLLLRWTGRWLAGGASVQTIRAAMAWAAVPWAWALLLWIPQLALFGDELFTTATPILDQSPMLIVAFLGFKVAEMTIALWASVIFLKALGQVQGFSAWKALGNVALVMLVIVVPIVVVAVTLALLYPR